jgi:photosystem II stability/assembly factor-like uncharacterized protein
MDRRAVRGILTVALLAATPARLPAQEWTNISDKLLADLAEKGQKPAWPGGCTGVAVDRSTGALLLAIPGIGLWQTRDKGATYERVDGGSVSGRCETGWALNMDPGGGRIFCFMLDGTSAMSPDLKSWRKLAPMGRGWDYAAVDWSPKEPRTVFAFRHESGGEYYLSTDAANSWKQVGKDPGIVGVGVIGPDTLLLWKKDGIQRSTDGGATWARVSEIAPQGRLASVFEDVAYVTTAEGLLVSKDKGQTWARLGSAIHATAGPFFGKKADHLIVAGKDGLFETQDGASTWKKAAPLPAGITEVGWFANFAWDPIGDVLYAARMGKPAFKFERR